jgi:ATP-dependent helicase/nuclease subunit A
MDGMVTAVFDDVIHEADHNISNSERDSLWTFFSSVIDEFIESDLWDRIQNAESVRVEQPIDGLVNESNIEIELHGTADFVVDSPSGERYVTDTKIALTEQTSATEKRYELQVAAYAYLFAQQCDQLTVCPTVETFGAARNTVTDSWPVKIIERRISTLLD